MSDAPRFRLIVGQRREWPWRVTRAEAVQDALDAGMAKRDEHVAGRIWWDALAGIETDG